MKGKIVKGISGFYYVHVAETGIYECKAKGIFRNQKIKPLVGAVLQRSTMILSPSKIPALIMLSPFTFSIKDSAFGIYSAGIGK